MTSGLDFEDIYSPEDKGWQIWTPDATGAVLGSGPTLKEALADAVANMEALCAKIRRKLKEKP